MSTLVPLTPLQEGMFYESTALDRPWVNLEQIVVQLSGEALDAAAMQGAWQGVTDAHEVLRLVIEERAEDHPVQRLHAPAPIPFGTLDWSTAQDPGEKLNDWLERDRLAGIDPRAFPAFRVTLIRFAPDRGVLVWTLHHTLLDGRSMGDVLDEAFTRYDIARTGAPAQPGHPQDDIFGAHCRALAGKDHAPGVDFFTQHLAGYDGAHRVVEPSVAPGRKRRFEAFLSESETAAIGDLATAAAVAPSTVVMAAWGIILARATQSSDAVFGMTLAGRHLVAGAEHALGCFITTVPIRLRLGDGQSLGDVLARLRSDQIALRPHAHTPLSEIQRASDVPGGQALFDSIVMFERAALPAAMAGRGGAWARRPVALHEEGGAGVMLAVYHEPRLRIVVEYDPAQVPEGARLAGYVPQLLRAMISGGVQAPLASLEMLAVEEADRLKALAMPEPVIEAGPRDGLALFEAAVEAGPDRVAVSQPGAAPLTYAALDARADALARGLRAHGVAPGDAVVLALPRSSDYIAALLACWKVGAAFVPIDPTYPASVQAEMCTDSRAVFAVAHPGSTALPCPVLSPDDLARMGQGAKIAASTKPDSRRAAYVIFTSGSTGRPKGVVVSHAALAAHSAAVAPLFGLGSADRVLQFASLSFDVSLEEIVPTLLAGATLVLRNDAMAASFTAFLEAVAEAGVSVLNLPTAFWSALTEVMEADGLALPKSVRLVVVGGERVPAPVLERWRALAPNLRWINGYGPTEATITCVAWEAPARGEIGDAVPIGRPLGHARALVLAPDGALAPFGAEGELWIAGPAVAEGYIGRDDLTAERFRPAPEWLGGGRMYRTGDLVRWRADGFLDYLGRVDRQVKLRGFRLEPEGIEKQIEAVDGVAHAVVAVDGGGGDGAAGPRLLAWVSLDAGADLAAVEARVQAVLPAFARPQVVAVEDWPKTPGGKIDIRRLPRPGASSLEPDGAGAAVDDDTRAVMAAFRKVLKLRHVGPDQSFFDLGGHSILMLRLIARLEGQMGLRTNVATVAAHPTPRALAKALRAGKVVLDPSVVVPIQPEGARPPIYGIHVIGENGSFFRPLAEALGADQPLFGLSVGQLSDTTPTGIEETARFYLEQIERHRPKGPLVLLSVSLGSYVAFELAQQLSAAGRDVRLLGLFDATGPAGRARKTGLAWLGLHARRLREGGFGYARGWGMKKIGDLRHKLQLARRRRREARGGDAAPALSIGQFVAANDLARQAYTPAPYSGAITVFRADENVFDSEAALANGLGWKPVAAGAFELVDVPGDHLSILTPPNVAALAAALEGALERVSPPD